LRLADGAAAAERLKAAALRVMGEGCTEEEEVVVDDEA
jgi:hypothetical protein